MGRYVPTSGMRLGGRTLRLVKRLSPLILLGALAALFLFRRREAEVVLPDAAWNPVDPS